MWAASTSHTATQSAKFIAAGPTAFQRSPVPMQPRSGRSFLLSVLASCAIDDRSQVKYGTLAEATAAEVFRNWRRERFVCDMGGSFGGRLVTWPGSRLV